MESVHISVSELIKIYRYMSVGKVINGLIHNLNGPLHSLGIEMDVLSHLLHKLKHSSTAVEIVENVSPRLRRMDEEFENLTRLIRLSAARMDVLQEQPDYFSLNHVLDQGLEFMKANLYFKHEVEKSIRLDHDLPAVKDPAENLGIGLIWFIQGLVEEMERQRIRSLDVVTSRTPSGPILSFTVEGGMVSDRMKAFLSGEALAGEGSATEAEVGMFLALRILLASGVRIEGRMEDTGFSVTLCFASLPSEGSD